jgi:HD-like signal output (HDOD) protein
MRRLPLEQEWAREQLCHHGFLTGLVAAQINQHLELGFEGEDFTAGLVHDIGRTVLGVAVPERFMEFDTLSFEEDDAVQQREFEVIESDHCRVGAWYAQSGGLPDPLVYAIAYHHCPANVPKFHMLTALTAAADHAANHLQRTEESQGYDPAQNRAISLIAALGSAGAVERFSDLYETIMDAAMEQIGDFT